MFACCPGNGAGNGAGGNGAGNGAEFLASNFLMLACCPGVAKFLVSKFLVFACCPGNEALARVLVFACCPGNKTVARVLVFACCPGTEAVARRTRVAKSILMVGGGTEELTPPTCPKGGAPRIHKGNQISS